MATISNPLSEIGRGSLEAAAKATRLSMDSAERAINVQLQYAKGALTQSTLTARAMGQAKDVQELMALRGRIAENALENMMGYSRSLYEVASVAQSAFSRLAAEHLASFTDAGVTAATRPARSRK